MERGACCNSPKNTSFSQFVVTIHFINIEILIFVEKMMLFLFLSIFLLDERPRVVERYDNFLYC